ncbi:keratin-associated protein 10-2-like [Rhipicephalus sanguineus]|uniref:keratin-associated protein 10-2-like n=1 Tax=Rhipicephalus sanguineus TaxID=34632 RepID=UPI0020C3596F|nr:keratin-associated protein 10-2-like [Rhipicephalus sanguineus]
MPPQPPSPCNSGHLSDAEIEEEKSQFPGMVTCPYTPCPCGEQKTCLKQAISCSCTCVKHHQGCDYAWQITCITKCITSGPRCLCVCVAPRPEPQPPCCPGSGQISNQGSSLPCCNTPSTPRPPCCRQNVQISSHQSSLPCCNSTQVVSSQASSLPCCQQNYGRR